MQSSNWVGEVWDKTSSRLAFVEFWCRVCCYCFDRCDCRSAISAARSTGFVKPWGTACRVFSSASNRPGLYRVGAEDAWKQKKKCVKRLCACSQEELLLSKSWDGIICSSSWFMIFDDECHWWVSWNLIRPQNPNKKLPGFHFESFLVR